MAAGLYEVVIGGTIVSQRWLMRLNYLSGAAVGVTKRSFLLAGKMVGQDGQPNWPGLQLNNTSVIGAMLQFMAQGCRIDQLAVFNVYDDEDFYSTSIAPALQGLAQSPVISPALAFKLTSSVVRRDIRPGQKAIPGVSQGAVQGDGQIAETYLNLINVLASVMSATLTVDDGGTNITFIPCVVQKEKYPVPDTNPVRYAYRYYKPEEQSQQFARIASGVTWSPKTTVRTQGTRQFGRGI